jgi:hypothetical protein
LSLSGFWISISISLSSILHSPPSCHHRSRSAHPPACTPLSTTTGTSFRLVKCLEDRLYNQQTTQFSQPSILFHPPIPYRLKPFPLTTAGIVP